MSATIDDPVLTLILGALIGSVASAFPTVWNALINRGLEQAKRLAALKTKIKKLLRQTAANAGPQIIEDLADELDEMAQLTGALKRKRRRKTIEKLQALIYSRQRTCCANQVAQLRAPMIAWSCAS